MGVHVWVDETRPCDQGASLTAWELAHPKVIAPDFDRFARTPWPDASLVSSGTNAFSSAFARSWSSTAGRVRR
jgi:hypothetical protein